MQTERSRSLMTAILIAAMAAAVALPFSAVGPGPVLANDKGKQATDKSKQEGVPARCARLIKASERQKCLQGIQKRGG